MQRYLSRIEKKLDETLPSAVERPSVVHEAMRYAVGAGGKRLRPVICLAAAEAVGGRLEDALAPAAAIELLHNYTLVHDDLPAMDNDMERRGKPSVWARYGEANAILVGDALQALAAKVIASTPECRSGVLAKVLASFGRAALGVVEGQVEDIAPSSGRDSLEFIFAHKTGDLFVSAAEMGAYAGGADDAQAAKLASYAKHLGFAFQYEDDLIDGDDGAFSSLRFLTRAEVEAKIGEHVTLAQKALDGLPGDTSFLRRLVAELVGRTV